MATVHPWINFNGNAEEACMFYKSVFGGVFAKVVRFEDIVSTKFPVLEKAKNKKLTHLNTGEYLLLDNSTGIV